MVSSTKSLNHQLLFLSFVMTNSKSVKSLGVKDVFCISAGAMISSGVLILPSFAYAKTGPSMIFAYFIAGLGMIPAMFSQCEFASSMPKSGLSYFSVARCLGTFPGVLAGFISWLCITFKAAFALVGLGTLFYEFFPGLPRGLAIRLIGLTFAIIFTVLNLATVKGTGSLQGFLVSGLILVLVAYVFRGTADIEIQNFSPFFANGFLEFIGTAGMVFVSFGGLTKVVDISEEIDKPTVNIPKGMFTSFLVVNFLYVALMYVTVGVIPGDELANSVRPIALGASKMIGAAGEIIIDVAAFLAFATTANAGILAAARSPLAMARDGLLPSFLAKTNAKGIPVSSVILTFLIAIVTLMLEIDELAKMASALFLISFILINLSVIVIRRSKFPIYTPSVKVPLFPYLNIFGIVLYTVLLLDMGKLTLMLVGVFMILTGLYYVFFARKSSTIQSIMSFNKEQKRLREEKNNSDLAPRRSAFEDELVSIVRHRDNIKPDLIDAAFEEAIVLDFPEAVSCEKVFDDIANKVAELCQCEPQVILDKLIEKDSLGCPLINTSVALFDLKFDVEDLARMVLVRSKDGIVFVEEGSTVIVNCLMVILRSGSNWSFDMKSVASLSIIVNNAEFIDRWNSAKNISQLRDLLLVSRRFRFE
ncbi:hypothetical protein RCL1_000441 [Eukaryota sp. TZLM3-RCL]